MNALPRPLAAIVAGLAVCAIALTAGCSSDSASAGSSTGDSAASTAAADAPTDSTATTAAGDAPTDGTESAAPTEPSMDSTVDITPAPTTPVPAAEGGDINQTVAAVPVTTASPVELAAAADFGTGVNAEVVSIDRITTTAQGPGEIAGPGLAVHIKLTNNSSAAVSLANVAVNLTDGAQTPALPITSSPAAPLTGSVDPGATAEGVYVFTLPTDYSDPASITVSYSAQAPTLVFTGDAP